MYKTQAKARCPQPKRSQQLSLASQALFKKMSSERGPPPPRLSLETGPFCFQCVSLLSLSLLTAALTFSFRCLRRSCLVARDVAYLTLAERSYPRKLAFQVCTVGFTLPLSILPVWWGVERRGKCSCVAR